MLYANVKLRLWFYVCCYKNEEINSNSTGSWTRIWCQQSAVNREMCPVEGQNWSMKGSVYILSLSSITVTLISGSWVCCLSCVILIVGCDTVSGLRITDIPRASLASASTGRSLTSERPEVGLTTTGKYSFGRSSNVIPTPYALTTPMNEIKDRMWSMRLRNNLHLLEYSNL